MSDSGVGQRSETGLRSRVAHYSRVFDRNFEGWLATVILILYALILLYNILTRIFLGTEEVWKQEIIIGLFIWMSWISVAYTIRVRDHLRFTLGVQRMSNTQKYVVSWIEWVLWLALSAVILRYSIPFLDPYLSSGATVTGTPIPEYFLRLSVPVGFALILLRVLQMMVIVTRKYQNGEEIEMGGEMG